MATDDVKQSDAAARKFCRYCEKEVTLDPRTNKPRWHRISASKHAEQFPGLPALSDPTCPGFASIRDGAL